MLEDKSFFIDRPIGVFPEMIKLLEENTDFLLEDHEMDLPFIYKEMNYYFPASLIDLKNYLLKMMYNTIYLYTTLHKHHLYNYLLCDDGPFNSVCWNTISNNYLSSEIYFTREYEIKKGNQLLPYESYIYLLTGILLEQTSCICN